MSQPVICIDASWWWGGNRDRGIGRYITYFVSEYYPVDMWQRVWIIPDQATPQEKELFHRQFGGQLVCFPAHQSVSAQRSRWMQLLEELRPQKVLIPSPFERPFSLLERAMELKQNNRFAFIETEAVVYDLIPMQYQRQVLHEWPVADQKKYQEQCSALQHVDHIFALSPHAQQTLEQFLQYPRKQTEVPDFIWQDDWLCVSPQILPVHKHGIPIVTIGGGEWRKNLTGTLHWFAQAYSTEHHLYVMGKLGLRERIGFHWYAFRKGIGLRVHFLGYVSEAQKWSWLFTCEGLLFLSKAEGLGIPLFEAHRAGVPRIIVSREIHDLGLHEYLAPYYEVALTS